MQWTCTCGELRNNRRNKTKLEKPQKQKQQKTTTKHNKKNTKKQEEKEKKGNRNVARKQISQFIRGDGLMNVGHMHHGAGQVDVLGVDEGLLGEAVVWVIGVVASQVLSGIIL